MQNFQIYSLSVIENILLRKTESRDEVEYVWDLLKKVGLYEKIKNTKNGLNTLLSKEFSNEGLELSGGERQRLVIARSLATNSPIIIFDEPTSSLDPIGEVQINDLILETSKNKTVILITHRLSTIVDVDIIFLMKDGQIIESGTHDELMKLNKTYHQMFETQAKYYKE